MYYFSDSSISEASEIINKIMVLFPEIIQEKLKEFVKDITINKHCKIEEYKELISLLKSKNNNEDPLKEEQVKKNTKKQYEEKQLKLEYLILMLSIMAFTSKKEIENNSTNLKKEISK